MTAPGWYPDPGGSGRQRYWNGAAWADLPPATPVYRKPWFIIIAVLVVLGLVGIVGESVAGKDKPTSPSTSSAPTAAPSYATPPPAPAAPVNCKNAPTAVVAQINAAFTNGEHLEDVQAVEGSRSATYVGGNIVDPAGARLSSHDTWVLLNGEVYALTSDARRRTLLKDGRGVAAITSDWPQFNEQVSQCISG